MPIDPVRDTREMTLYQTELPIRPDIVQSHTDLLNRWATPGAWWDSAERLAIVEEVRRARDADELAPWVAPSAVDGLIAADHPLPAVAIDVIWRLTNHPGTLTADWYQTIIDAGLSSGRYTELVGIVAQANCVDRFADALDITRPALPEARPGEPSHDAPDDVAVRKHWVPTAAIKGPNVVKALSAVPFENDSRDVLSDSHYVKEEALVGDLSSDVNALSRLQVELIAARTSKLNECFY